MAVLTMAACHETDPSYQPTPEVVLASSETWIPNAANGTYTLEVALENIGDADARNITAEFQFGTPDPVENVFIDVGYISWGGRRLLVIDNLLYKYVNDYHVKLQWYDRYGYRYTNYY